MISFELKFIVVCWPQWKWNGNDPVLYFNSEFEKHSNWSCQKNRHFFGRGGGGDGVIDRLLVAFDWPKNGSNILTVFNLDRVAGTM